LIRQREEKKIGVNIKYFEQALYSTYCVIVLEL